MKKAKKWIRRGAVIACEIFAVVTIIWLLAQGDYRRVPLAVGTLGMVFLPSIAQALMHCTFPLPMYLYCLLYSIGPMLGQCYKFYYRFRFWDKLLHISGGVLFAIFGFYLYYKLGGSRQPQLLAALFALLFSMGVSVVWEFFEFGADRLFGWDMQNDTVISEIHSYELGGELGERGSLQDIQLVSIDGTPLPFEGYLDIGLIDTMMDMLLETCGALVTVVGFSLNQKKRFAKIPLR